NALPLPGFFLWPGGQKPYDLAPRFFVFAARYRWVASVVLRRGEVLFTPVLVAACAGVKTEPVESTATAAIKMLKERIKFLPVFRPLNRSINAECQSQSPCFAR